MKQAWKINLVNQPNNSGCALACVAMVAGVSYAEAEKSLYGISGVPLSEESMLIALCRLGVLPRKQLEAQIFHDRVYIADVPSLNKKRAMHSVVIDSRDVFTVYDPQAGMEGKEWYTADSLSGWANLVYCVRVLGEGYNSHNTYPTCNWCGKEMYYDVTEYRFRCECGMREL